MAQFILPSHGVGVSKGFLVLMAVLRVGAATAGLVAWFSCFE